MAYCRKCGMEIDDEAVICVHCGVPTDKFDSARGGGKANIGLIILSFWLPLVGIILGLYYNSCGKKNAGRSYLIAAAIPIIFIMFCVLIAFLFLPEGYENERAFLSVMLQ